MDAALQEIRVSGQCGTIPRSPAFQGEACCEMYHVMALRDICQHLKETNCDQVSGDRALRAGEKAQEIFLHTHPICKNISELKVRLVYQFSPEKEGTALTYACSKCYLVNA